METTQDMDLPDLRKTPGGWLAVALDSPRVAVVAETPDRAVEKFRAERAIWRQLISEASDERSGDGA